MKMYNMPWRIWKIGKYAQLDQSDWFCLLPSIEFFGESDDPGWNKIKGISICLFYWQLNISFKKINK